MSIKLYDGVRWPTGDVWGVQRQVRPLMAAARRAREAKMIAGAAVTTARQRLVDGGDPATMTGAWIEIGKQIRSAERGDVRSPFDLSVTLCLVRSHIDGMIYGRAYGFWPDLRDAANAGSEPCGWWDNSDRPDDLTEADWAHRRAVWAGMLDDFRMSLGEAGLTIKVDSGCIDACALPYRCVDDADPIGEQIVAQLAELDPADGPVPTFEQITGRPRT